MKKEIAALSMHELRVTAVYTGSIGELRYRFHMEFDSNELEAATYTKWCYEKADDVETARFTIENERAERMDERTVLQVFSGRAGGMRDEKC